jgi:cytochrome c553
VHLRSALRAASRIGYALFLACALPGLWVLVGEPAWPLHFAALRLHVLAGEVLAVVALPALLAHLWLTGSRPFAALLVAALPLAAGWWLMARGGALAWVRDGYLHRGISAAEGAGLSVLALVVVAAAVQALPRLERPQRTRISGLLLSLAAGPAIAWGWTGLTTRGDARWGALIGHSALGLLTIALLVPHHRAVRRRWPGRRGAVASVVALAALAAGWGWWIERGYFSGLEARGAEARWTTSQTRGDGPPDVPLDASFVGVSEGCGAAGCHPALTEEWRGSAHRFAADNALVQAAVAGLVRDRGPAAAVACANCHDPDRAMAGQVEAAWAEGVPPPGDGVSCLSCHVAWDAPRPIGDGIVRFRHPRPDGSRDGDRRVLLDPRLHRQNFQASEHLMSDEGCGVCHRATKELEAGHAAIQNPYRADGDPGPPRPDIVVSCGLCHMPTTTPQPGGRMPLYEHRWPGINVDLAAYITHPDRSGLAAGTAATQRFLEGALGTAHLPDALDDNPEFAAYARAAEAPGILDVALEAHREGDAVHVAVTTGHRRAAHPFPVGPFDLHEVWLEVLVQDAATGRTLAQVGALVDGVVDAAAPRLGGRELEADGRPLREHRLDRLRAVEDVRQVWPGQQIVDELRLELDGEPEGALLVAAAWRFRRVTPEFAAFALGPGGLERFSVLTLGAATSAVGGERR